MNYIYRQVYYAGPTIALKTNKYTHAALRGRPYLNDDSPDHSCTEDSRYPAVLTFSLTVRIVHNNFATSDENKENKKYLSSIYWQSNDELMEKNCNRSVSNKQFSHKCFTHCLSRRFPRLMLSSNTECYSKKLA